MSKLTDEAPSRSLRSPPGWSRMVPVWHAAQLRPTSSTGSSRSVVPIGRLCPGSYRKPNFSQPSPGRSFGRRSANMTGNRSHSGAGTPRRASVPIEPYLKCSTMSGYATGTRLRWRKLVAHTAPMPPSTRSDPRTTSRIFFLRRVILSRLPTPLAQLDELRSRLLARRAGLHIHIGSRFVDTHDLLHHLVVGVEPALLVAAERVPQDLAQ